MRSTMRKVAGVLLVVVCGYGIAYAAFEFPKQFVFTTTLSYVSADDQVTEKPFVRAIAAIADAMGGRDTDAPIRVVAVGDIMLDRGVSYIVGKAGAGDLYFPFNYIREEIAGADIAFGNLEGPVSNQGNNVGSMYSFRMPVENVRVLEDVGFDVLSFANNHVGDWNLAAFTDTLTRFAASRVALAGAGMKIAEAERPVVRSVSGTRIGFLGFSDVGPNWIRATEDRPGILIASVEDIDRLVRQARPQVDILVVSFHFGEEYQTTSNARQRVLAHAAVDAGADAVIGHHPHVGQEVENYHGAPIAYSLGNFVFDQRFSEDTSKGLLLELEIVDKKISKYQTKELNFNAYFQPLPTWDISTTTTFNN